MSAPLKQMDQVAATHEFNKAFHCSNSPTETAFSIFPTRVTEDNQLDASEVNNSLAKIKQNASKLYRSLHADVTKARNSELQKPDSVLKFLFRCRKNHVFYDKMDRQEFPAPSTENCAVLAGCIPVVYNGSTPPSPFLRRAVSRDPIHKIKEEIPSPGPLSQVNGQSNHARSRSQNRSRSNAEGFSQPIKSSLSIQSQQYGQAQNSIEKTSASNPLYFNVQHGTPLRPGFRAKEEPLSAHNTRISYGKPPPAPRPTDPPPYPGKPLWARTGTTPTVPPESLFRELRGALRGINGMYFTNDGRGHLIISKTCSLSDSMYTAVQDLLNIGNTFIDIRKQVSRFGDSDLVRGALIEAIRCIMDKYFTDIGDLPLKTPGKSDLQLLLSRTFNWHMRLNVVKRCLEHIHEPGLHLQEEVYCLWKTCLGTEAESVANTILEATLSVFCNALRCWINSGVLVDNKWVLEEVNGEVGYKIIFYPCFVHGISFENVLKIGISQSFMAGRDFEKVESFRNLVEAYVIPSNLLTAEGRAKINCIFTQMADWLGRKVIDQLLDEGHFMLHLSAARKFLLLDDAHFCVALHKCIHKMSATKIELSRDEALTAFVTAIKQSPAAKQFPFRVVIDTLVSPSSTPIASARSVFIQSIHPLMRVTGIAERAFKNTQSGYEVLFHFLWSLQTALYSTEHSVTRLRQIQKEACPKSEHLHRLMSAVCTRFLRIFLAIKQYSLIAISQTSARFHVRLGEANDVESVAKQHCIFLEELKSALFCDQENEKLAGLINNLVQLAYRYSKKNIQFEEEIMKSSKKGADTSDSVIEFEATEQALGLNLIRTELLAINKTLMTALTNIHSELSEIRERTPLVSIILFAQ